MVIEADLVRKIAHLARINVLDSEVSYFCDQLKSILDFVEVLEAMPDPLGSDFRTDTLGVPTTERADVVRESLSSEDILNAAPEKADQTFQVPRIIE